MKRGKRRIFALLLSLVLLAAFPARESRAALSGVYFTAANEQLLELSADTMPFWSGEKLYVSSKLFEGTDLGVTYVRNTTIGLAVLYTARTDLRFDLVNKTAYDKQGVTYDARAIERSGQVFFPVDVVCQYFGLTWSYTETETVPLIRLQSSRAILEDSGFVDAAAGQMRSRYAAYEKWFAENGGSVTDPGVVHAAAGQKVFLIINCLSREDTLSVLEQLEGEQVTVVLTAEQLADGDLARALSAGGHAIALRLAGDTEEAVAEEIRLGREELWQSACAWLSLVWYEGGADMRGLLETLGCVSVTPRIDRREKSLSTAAQARSLQTEIGRYRADLPVYLGDDAACLPHLDALLQGLRAGQYRICACRLSG